MNAFSFVRTATTARSAASVRTSGSGIAVFGALALLAASLVPTPATASGPAAAQVYPVTVGKRIVWSSTASKPVGTVLSAATVAPPAVSAGGKGDYLTTIGKRTVWASQVPAVTSSIVVGLPKDDCMGSRFVTTGKTTVWAAGCSRCVTGTDLASVRSNSHNVRHCTVGQMACSSGTTMTSLARTSLCCTK